MTTSTTSTPAASTAATVATAISKRPLTLALGAAVLVLAALLTFASPFIRGRSFIGGGGGGGGAPAANGNRVTGQVTAVTGTTITVQGGRNAQATQTTQTPQTSQTIVTGDSTKFSVSGQTGTLTDVTVGMFVMATGQRQSDGSLLATQVQVFNRSAGGAAGGTGGGTGAGSGTGVGGGFGGARGGNAALFQLITPIRIAEGVIGGLFTLIAAWGIWKRQKWGLVLALIAAVVMLLTGAVSVFLPLVGQSLGRAAGSLFTFTAFVSGNQLVAIVGMLLAIVVAVLVLLPVSQKGYLVAPKVRRVM